MQHSTVQGIQARSTEALPSDHPPDEEIEGRGAEKRKRVEIFPTKVLKQPDTRTIFTQLAGQKIAPPSNLSPAPQQATPEKTIKVTIGRIEVRAVMAQAPLSVPPTGEKKAGPKISLEDYLKKQRGGG
jgi:hypothetical protein